MFATLNQDTGVHAEVITITPDMAEEMLGRNTRNRNIVKSALATIERALLNGEWRLNGEAVKLALDGTILDGQHRLTACVNTRVAFQTLIVRGLPAETQETMDGGAKRTVAQMLTIAGVANANLVGSMAKATVAERTYGFKRALGRNGDIGPVTRSEILAEAYANPEEYQRLSHLVRPIQKFAPMNSGPISLMVRRFETLDAEDSDFFWARVVDGQALMQGDPIYALRSAYQAITDKTARYRDPVTAAAITIKAWNAFRRGEEIKLLRYRVGGATPERFPDVV